MALRPEFYGLQPIPALNQQEVFWPVSSLLSPDNYN
ncbi:MAG: hypothetical protein K0R49_1471 [Burkholderiales bacterium]|jgi:hypothetical protein|nr:hypothetical protein [Burkholderiales bacterium]